MSGFIQTDWSRIFEHKIVNIFLSINIIWVLIDKFIMHSEAFLIVYNVPEPVVIV